MKNSLLGWFACCLLIAGVAGVASPVFADVAEAIERTAEVERDIVHGVAADEPGMVLTSPQPGHTAEDHGGEDAGLLSFDLGSAFFNLLIFVFVFAVLSAFVWPGILNGLKAREDKIRGDLEAAEAANVKARRLLQEYQVKLDEAAQQVQSMLADARRDAEATGQRIIDEAKGEALRQQSRAVAEIETAKKVAMSDIAGQTSDIALKLARSVVGRELRADDHADLIRQSLDRMPSQN